MHTHEHESGSDLRSSGYSEHISDVFQKTGISRLQDTWITLDEKSENVVELKVQTVTSLYSRAEIRIQKMIIVEYFLKKVVE